MKQIGIFFTINSNYINQAKVFFSSFLYFNKRSSFNFHYHAYKWSELDNISEIKSILPNLKEHVLSYPKNVSLTTTDNVFHAKDNNVFIASILAVDDMLNKGYDYVIHVDLDMLCLGSIEPYLKQLNKMQDWEVAGANESYTKFTHTFFTLLGRHSKIKLKDDNKFNFGFLILNARQVLKNNFNKWLKYYQEYGDDFRCPDELYFSLAYDKKIYIPEINFLDWSPYKVPMDKAVIIHFAGDFYYKPWEYPQGAKNVIWKDIIHYYWFFSKYANCSADFISKIATNLVWAHPNNLNYYPKSPLAHAELKLLNKIKLNDLLSIKADIAKEPEDKSIGLSDLIVATTTSYDYLDATYVCLHSLLKYNDISKINVYLINPTEVETAVAIKKFKRLKPVKIIPYSYKSAEKTILHFNREYVDSKIEILDTLTSEYSYTLMIDSDLLFQGNLKNSLLSSMLSDKRIFGIKDSIIINNDAIRSLFPCYINGGFILYKKGKYRFKENYFKWLKEPKAGSLGKYNEQDFINDCYKQDIQYLQTQNNYTVYHQSVYHTKPLVIHYIGGNKPFLDLKVYSNAIDTFFTYHHQTYYIYTYFYPIYLKYVLSISKELSPLFIKTVKICCSGSRYHYYNAEAHKYLLKYFKDFNHD